MRGLIFPAIAALALSSSTFAEDIDFSAPEIKCDLKEVEGDVRNLIENGPLGTQGVRLLYLKEQHEVSRNATKLVCRATLVFNVGGEATFNIVMEDKDEHVLVHLEPIAAQKVNRKRR